MNSTACPTKTSVGIGSRGVDQHRNKVKAKDKAEIPKAEAITIIEQAGDNVVLIVNHDNVDEGAPSRHEINLKR